MSGLPRRRVQLAHLGFLVGMAFKALDGALELVGGAMLMFVSVPQIDRWVWRVTGRDLGDGLLGRLARLLRHGADGLSTADKHFATTYLLIEGVIKLLLVFGLLRGIRWTYPAGLLLLALFCVYQGLRLEQTFSPLLAALTVLNLAIMVLIAVEWRAQVAARAAAVSG